MGHNHVEGNNHHDDRHTGGSSQGGFDNLGAGEIEPLQKKLPGTPDIVLPKYKTAIFVNGCFWHGHKNCRYFVIPKTRTEWWLDKINRNIDRDQANILALKKSGWRVITIWECQLKPAIRDDTLLNLSKIILTLK